MHVNALSKNKTEKPCNKALQKSQLTAKNMAVDRIMAPGKSNGQDIIIKVNNEMCSRRLNIVIQINLKVQKMKQKQC
jgi:hypothetical protein